MKVDREPGRWNVWTAINAAARADNSGLSLRHAILTCEHALSANGVGVSLNHGGSGSTEPMLATSRPAADLEELQYALGEGPSRDVVGVTGPVLVTDLTGPVAAQRWPMFAPAAVQRGILSMFVFPLQVGAGRLGVLSVYRARTGELRAGEVADGLAFADAATVLALDRRAGACADAEQETAFSAHRAEVHQATGMVAAHTGVSIADALALLRGYAYTSDQSLPEVAAEIVAGRLVLEIDGPSAARGLDTPGSPDDQPG